MQARTTEESWSLSKPAVRGTKGMVSSQHYLATEVGLAILKEGGNAIDAAIATGLMLGVVEPWMSGYGGGGYLLAYLKAEDRVVQVEFGMRAPFASHASDYPLAQ
ncbi:gamma-glutamyltransferase, partial [Pseudomonadales bacterium]|nr:gamma-glutamyltransferase [Pseudomonadales bacterium]